MASSLLCNDCGIPLIIGYSWRETDVKPSRYVCKDCDNERRAKRSQDNKDMENARKLQWYHVKRYKNTPNFKYYHSIRGRYTRYKYSARIRDIVFKLRIEDVTSIIKKPCKYCGYKSKYYNGIDRVDNQKGYTKENCVSCCAYCNRMKSNYNIKDFIGYCKKITEHQEVMLH